SARMRLVTELRDEIDRRRAKAVVDSPAAVRRILSRIGTPSEVVTAATHTAGPGPETADTPAASAPAAVPVQRDPGSRETGSAPATDLTKRPGRTKGVLGRIVPGPRPAAPSGPDPVPPPAAVPSSPHRAGADELGDSAAQPDWWRVDSSPFGVGDEVPGFVGGGEIPGLLKPPPDGTPPADAGPEAETADEPPAPAPSSPRRAGADELGDSAAPPDWGRVDSSPFGVGDEVPGFVGGAETAELLKPPPDGTPRADAGAGAETAAEPAAAAVPAAVE